MFLLNNFRILNFIPINLLISIFHYAYTLSMKFFRLFINLETFHNILSIFYILILILIFNFVVLINLYLVSFVDPEDVNETSSLSIYKVFNYPSIWVISTFWDNWIIILKINWENTKTYKENQLKHIGLKYLILAV